MDAVAEGEVAAGVAADVEAVRGRVAGAVAVGRAQADHHRVALSTARPAISRGSAAYRNVAFSTGPS